MLVKLILASVRSTSFKVIQWISCYSLQCIYMSVALSSQKYITWKLDSATSQPKRTSIIPTLTHWMAWSCPSNGQTYLARCEQVTVNGLLPRVAGQGNCKPSMRNLHQYKGQARAASRGQCPIQAQMSGMCDSEGGWGAVECYAKAMLRDMVWTSRVLWGRCSQRDAVSSRLRSYLGVLNERSSRRVVSGSANQ